MASRHVSNGPVATLSVATGLPAPRSAARLVGMGLYATAIAVAFVFLSPSPVSRSVRSFSLVFSGIVLEAVPFMFIGSLIGGLIEAFVSRERLTALLPKRRWAAVCVAAGMGMVFPICECAVVPIARRLAKKGLPASAAIAYLLGGPIVNPLVIASTALAYKLVWGVVVARTLLGYAIAVFVALAIERLFKGKRVFIDEVPSGGCSCGHCHHDHADHHETRHRDHNAADAFSVFSAKLVAAIRHAADDFVAVARFLIIGAAIAALARTFVDQGYFTGPTAFPFVSAIMMMALAAALNLCSEADAFIAASFQGLVTLPAQMAFMLTGPMFDLKLLMMYQGVFRRHAIVALVTLTLTTIGAVVVVMEIVWRFSR